MVLARLVGDPADRLDRVLARRIGTPSEFLRFVLVLLQLAGRESPFPEGQGGETFGDFAMGEGGTGLLETVLTALASAPIQRLGDLHQCDMLAEGEPPRHRVRSGKTKESTRVRRPEVI